MRKRMQSVEGLLPFLAEVVAEENRLLEKEREVLRAWRVAERWEAGAPKREAKELVRWERRVCAEELKVHRLHRKWEAKYAAMEGRVLVFKDVAPAVVKVSKEERAQKRAEEKRAAKVAEAAKWAGYWDGLCKFVGAREEAA